MRSFHRPDYEHALLRQLDHQRLRYVDIMQQCDRLIRQLKLDFDLLTKIEIFDFLPKMEQYNAFKIETISLNFCVNTSDLINQNQSMRTRADYKHEVSKGKP